jgi:hypothetical protein
LAKERDIFTDWSEPTPEVFVPLGSELLAGDINPKEPAAKIMVRQFDPEKAVTAVHEFELARGATANADGIEVSLPKTGPATGGVGAADAVKEKVDFRTDATMVDLVGGNKLAGGPSGTKAPGRMLVMRSDGELALLSELSDAARFEKEADKLKEAKDAGKPKEPGAAAEAAGAGGAAGFDQYFQEPAPKKKGRR